MRLRFISLLPVLVGIAASTTTVAQQAAPPQPAVNYRVEVDANAEAFLVTGDLVGVVADTVEMRFPIWGPGAYDIVNFGAYVGNFTATSTDGRALPVTRTDTNTFRIIAGRQRVSIAYRVKDIERASNSLWFGLSDIESDYAFANTPAVFAYPAGWKHLPYGVTYVAPKGWDVHVGLDPGKGKGVYVAADYDDLVDAPVVMGRFQRFGFKINGVQHDIVVKAPEKLSAAAAKRLTANIQSIVGMISNFFGEIPYKRYVFQLFLVRPTPEDALFGALEHRNSSTYRMPWYGDEGIDGLDGVLAHEYWHAWSPKRIHVAELGPFDYQRAPRTTSLWFAEGLTEYYARLLLARNGRGDRNETLEQLSRIVTAYGDKPQSRSIADLSMHIAEAPPYEALPLYSKGPVIGLLLDLTIRQQTSHRKSLDDAMRYFNEKYGRTGRTFADDDIIPEMERATGARLADFYNRYIAGTEALPFHELLPKAGLAFDTTYDEKAQFGATVDKVDDGWKITTVSPGGSAEAMGLKTGDLLREVRSKRGSAPLARIPVIALSTLTAMPDIESYTVVRGEVTMQVASKVVVAKVANITVRPDPAASPAALAMRRELMGF